MVYLVAVIDVAIVVCGCHNLPCGRHGRVVWPSWFVAVIDLADMVVAVMV